MKRCAAWAFLSGLFVFTSIALTQQPVTILLKDRHEGEPLLITKNDTLIFKIKREDAKGNILFDDETISELAEYKETILKRDTKNLTLKLEREYIKAQTKKGNKVVNSPLEGKTVIIEKKGAGYAFSYKGGEMVGGVAASKLMQEFSIKKQADPELVKLLLPQNTLKTGDTWKLNMGPLFALLTRGLEMEADMAQGKGTGTLRKIYMQNGKRFGELNFLMELPLKTVFKAAQQMKFSPGAKLLLEVTLDGCIDGRSETRTRKTKMTLIGNATRAQEPGTTLVVNIIMEDVQTQREWGAK